MPMGTNDVSRNSLRVKRSGSPPPKSASGALRLDPLVDFQVIDLSNFNFSGLNRIGSGIGSGIGTNGSGKINSIAGTYEAMVSSVSMAPPTGLFIMESVPVLAQSFMLLIKDLLH